MVHKYYQRDGLYSPDGSGNWKQWVAILTVTHCFISVQVPTIAAAYCTLETGK